jgi:hypothetical protein
MCENEYIYRSGDTITFDIVPDNDFSLSEIVGVRLVNKNGYFVTPKKEDNGDRYTYVVSSAESSKMTLGDYSLEIKYGSEVVEIINEHAFTLKRSTYKIV